MVIFLSGTAILILAMCMLGHFLGAAFSLAALLGIVFFLLQGAVFLFSILRPLLRKDPHWLCRFGLFLIAFLDSLILLYMIGRLQDQLLPLAIYCEFIGIPWLVMLTLPARSAPGSRNALSDYAFPVGCLAVNLAILLFTVL